MQPETEVSKVLPWQQQYELVVSDSKEMNLSRRAGSNSVTHLFYVPREQVC